MCVCVCVFVCMYVCVCVSVCAGVYLCIITICYQIPRNGYYAIKYNK